MPRHSHFMTRRHLLEAGGASALTLAALSGSRQAFAVQTVTLPFGNGDRAVVQYPQKRPLIRLTTRPPQLETPFSVFNEGVITNNDAFFVRYHLVLSPPSGLDIDAFRIAVKGKVNKLLNLSVADLRSNFTPTEIVAVNQCSGNGRAFSNPRVAGGQFGNGAMGNARWKGVPLKAILDMAAVQEAAKQVTFNGLDAPASEQTPDFIKALDIDHARDGEVMVAYEMNGQPLPILNGFPVRLVVPGYYGTYWVKHLSEINVIDNVFDGFWMKTAYRIPNNTCACISPGDKTATTPINRLNVRSFITSVKPGAKVPANKNVPIRGFAFDGGYGIVEVALSPDGGQTWQQTKLGNDLGRYSFREWHGVLNLAPGPHDLRVRAINRAGQSQPMEPLWNPAGYMRNVVETVRVIAS
jgi:sulfite dehydrogenase (cytochrome) subunit A